MEGLIVKTTGNTLGHAELCWISNMHEENQSLKL